jgi:hypothetical protein
MVLLVVMKRQGGQAQFSPLIATVATQETPITRVQSYLLEHLEEEFSIERMATMAAMSPRHFARVFSREVNMTPMEFIQNARLDRARTQDRGPPQRLWQRALHAFAVHGPARTHPPPVPPAVRLIAQPLIGFFGPHDAVCRYWAQDWPS